jgi:type I restriction enzyme, S subunit
MSRDLPAGWVWARLQDLAEISSGSTPSNAEAQSFASGQIPWFKVSSMNLQGNETLMRHSRWWFTRADAEKLRLSVIKSGSLIFPKLGGALLTNKRRVLGIDAAIDMNLMAVTAYGPFQDYVNRFFDTLDMANFSDGSVVSQLKKSILQTIPIPLAPLPEQQRIVARIDELFAEIAEGEAALERARRGLDTWRRALLKAAVTGELTRDWREANRPAETGADLLASIRAGPEGSHARGRRAAPEPLDTSSLPELPDGWAWACLGEIIESLRNGTATVPIKRQTECSILRISAVRPMAVDGSDVRYLDENSTHGLEEYRTQSGDLLFTRYNGSRHLVGVCGILRGGEPVYYPDKIIRVRLLPQLQEITSFFEAAINSGATRKFIDGEIKTTAGQHGISGASLKRAPIPIPPISEAKRIVESLQDDLSRAEDIEALQAIDLKAAAALRQSILKAAFEGRLVPQDPSDEPASALLARLRDGSAGAHGPRRRRGRKRNRPETPGLPLFAGREDGSVANAAS